ncbi:hypothetical protein [Devosia nitrariae]|uniref:Antibiotic biosynthesis monooxygenase n=1 Tax=Devosia nitrariae TaxID=2071872 RepID=A0ABQ5WA51_9HYPH|nr:hypothetical protein [Devosia nitrariae]GLQ56425.1 hypothetical protein GCM10010862_36840 [Devosia nitrariae]
MSFTAIRYRIKPELRDENRIRIEAVFAELTKQAPEDLRYMALQLEDGTFIHIVDRDSADDPFEHNAAFKAFTVGLNDRQAEPTVRQAEPTVRQPARVVGQYWMLAGN